MSQDAAEELPPWAPPRDEELVKDDGVPMETQRHLEQMNLLIEVLRRAFAAQGREAYVNGNMFVYFSELQVRGMDFRGPDVFAVLDADRHIRDYWVAWKEGGRLPDLVIELLSDSTRAADLGEKKRIYERVWKVVDYVLYDPLTAELLGFHLSDGRYTPIEPDAEGRLPLHSADMSLGTVEQTRSYDTSPAPWLRLFDGEGELVPTEAEAEAARAESEAARAESEAARAESEAARAAEADQRAETLACRVAELEARLGGSQQ